MKSISQTQTALGDIAKQLCGIVSETDRENGALAGLNEEVQKLIEELQSAVPPLVMMPETSRAVSSFISLSIMPR